MAIASTIYGTESAAGQVSPHRVDGGSKSGDSGEGGEQHRHHGVGDGAIAAAGLRRHDRIQVQCPQRRKRSEPETGWILLLSDRRKTAWKSITRGACEYSGGAPMVIRN